MKKEKKRCSTDLISSPAALLGDFKTSTAHSDPLPLICHQIGKKYSFHFVSPEGDTVGKNKTAAAPSSDILKRFYISATFKIKCQNRAFITGTDVYIFVLFSAIGLMPCGMDAVDHLSAKYSS